MIPENFKILIEKLKEKTLKKEASWNKTSRDEEYKLDLGKGAITTDRWINEDEESMIDIAVLNESGDMIDYFGVNSNDKESYIQLLELHTIVRRAYLKIDDTFKMIFNELDSDRKIGREKKTDS